MERIKTRFYCLLRMLNIFDDTTYLMASDVNRKQIDESIRQIEAGERIRVSLDEIWK